MSQVFDTVAAVRRDLHRVLLERSGSIDNALLALLTRQHYLQIGPPGTAKSMLVDALHARITGARRFKRVLNPGTTDTDLLGPHDLVQMADHGKWVRRHARSIVEADLAFLDETGRGNQMVYDLLLQILGEEREVDELGMDQPLKLPLISVFGASNSHLSGNEHLSALNNRFLLREEIAPVSERASLIRLATQPPKLTEVQATLTLNELRQAQAEAQTVRGTDEVLQAALDLKEHLRGEGVSVSDRMWVWSFPLLKAQAWLAGKDEMELEDLGALAAAWWSDPKEKAVVQRAIFAVANPLDLQALEIEDDALDLLKQMPGDDDRDWLQQAESTNVQLQDMLTTLMAAIKGSRARDKRRAVAALQKIHTAQTGVAQALAKRMHLGTIDIDALVA